MRSGVVAFRDAMAAAGGLLDRARAGPSLLSLGVLGVVAILILPVPAGLLDARTRAEVLDLLAYLEAGGRGG